MLRDRAKSCKTWRQRRPADQGRGRRALDPFSPASLAPSQHIVPSCLAPFGPVWSCSIERRYLLTSRRVTELGETRPQCWATTGKRVSGDNPDRGFESLPVRNDNDLAHRPHPGWWASSLEKPSKKPSAVAGLPTRRVPNCGIPTMPLSLVEAAVAPRHAGRGYTRWPIRTIFGARYGHSAMIAHQAGRLTMGRRQPLPGSRTLRAPDAF
jgi:hypothetical protein